jgi:putative spermidine/putrescine transport system substrate-binding protein
MHIRTTMAAGMLLGLLAGNAPAQDALTVVNYGGANGAAQRKAFVEPFTRSSGIAVTVAEYAGEQAKVKAMVDAGRVTWDVVEVESADVERGCEQGLYEPLDWQALGGKSQFLPQAVTECGAGFFVWATVLAYNKGLVKEAPTGWKDFWDVNRFPGKRGLRTSARGTLEFALMADGVAPKDVYATLATPAGVDRAFRQLDKLRPNIQWWTAGAQPPQILLAGDVAMTSAFGGRIRSAMSEGGNVGIVWRQTLSDLDYWVIPKGAPNKALGQKYIAYTLQPAVQKEFVTIYPNGPVNVEAFKQMTPDQLAVMPNAPENMKTALIQSASFWNEHGDDLDQRFAVWAAR